MVAVALLWSATLMTLVVARAGRWRPRSRGSPPWRIAIVGTFHNPNWILSHAIPLSRSGAEPSSWWGTTRFRRGQHSFLPSSGWLRRLSGPRPQADLPAAVGWRERPDLYVGLISFPARSRPDRRADPRPPRVLPDDRRTGRDRRRWLRQRELADGQPPPTLVASREAGVGVVREFELVVALGRKATTFLLERRSPEWWRSFPGASLRPRPRRTPAARSISCSSDV